MQAVSDAVPGFSMWPLMVGAGNMQGEPDETEHRRSIGGTVVEEGSRARRSKLWIPSRATLADPKLARVAAPSPEEQRLTELYRKKGLTALVEELKRFQ